TKPHALAHGTRHRGLRTAQSSATPAQLEQRERKLATTPAQPFDVGVHDLEFAGVLTAPATVRHPDALDLLGQRDPALHDADQLGVDLVDLFAQPDDLGEAWVGLERLEGLRLRCLGYARIADAVHCVLPFCSSMTATCAPALCWQPVDAKTPRALPGASVCLSDQTVATATGLPEP